MDVRLDGRVALITGGSAGLGKAMAREFARSGASVAIAARQAERLAEAKAAVEGDADGGRVAAIPGDVAKAGDCARIHDGVVRALGPVDILINNAGTSARGPFLEVTDEDWQTDLDLKLFAAIRLARLVLPGMKERRWGRIINVLATAAKAPPAEGAPTAVSRAAGLALTKVLANEAAPFGVLVNALHVGWIDSDQWARRHAGRADGSTYRSYLDGMGESIPLGRVGRAEEFANLALFLASEHASYVTGTSINVDGGKSPVW